MSETFDVYIKPPKPSFSSLVRALYAALRGAGWEPASMAVLGNEGYRNAPVPPAREVDKLSAVQVAFERGGRGWSLGIGFLEPEAVTLGSDATFFDSEAGVDDVRMVLSRVEFPPDTVVIGDSEYRLMGTIESNFPLVSPSRLKGLGLHWIDMLNRAQLSFLRKQLGERALAPLGVSGEYQIVMLWENPYDRAGIPLEFPRLSRELGNFDMRILGAEARHIT